jgi:hypothetical protein
VANLLDSGPGSLRQTILDTPAGGAVDFQPGLTGTIILTTGELELHNSITIQGPGADGLAVSGNDASRVFEVFGGATVTLADLTITHGQISVSGTGNVTALGGGVYVNANAALTVHGAILSSNSVQASAAGSGVNSATAEGGAIFSIVHRTPYCWLSPEAVIAFVLPRICGEVPVHGPTVTKA